MRSGKQWGTRAMRLPVVLLGVVLLGLAAAPAAQAAAPAGSLTPFVSCYFDNGDNSYTVSVGVTSSNSGTVTVPVGTDNRVTVGAQDRGQPTTFSPGTHTNVWVPTVTAAEVSSGINWSLTGNQVRLFSFSQCSSRPVPAEGNTLAVVAFGLVVTVAGAALMGERSRRRPRSPGNVS